MLFTLSFRFITFYINRQICFFNNSYKFSELQRIYNNKKLGSCEYCAELQKYSEKWLYGWIYSQYNFVENSYTYTSIIPYTPVFDIQSWKVRSKASVGQYIYWRIRKEVNMEQRPLEYTVKNLLWGVYGMVLLWMVAHHPSYSCRISKGNQCDC